MLFNLEWYENFFHLFYRTVKRANFCKLNEELVSSIPLIFQSENSDSQVLKLKLKKKVLNDSFVFKTCLIVIETIIPSDWFSLFHYFSNRLFWLASSLTRLEDNHDSNRMRIVVIVVFVSEEKSLHVQLWQVHTLHALETKCVFWMKFRLNFS